jgi:hypothetical protein
VAGGFLSTYLNDHLAGAQAGLEVVGLLRTLADSEVWRSVEKEIADDRQELQGLMDRTGARPSALRRATAWTAEKLAELKTRVDDSSSEGALRRLELIEALAIGIDGKRALWTALQRASESASDLRSLDYRRLIDRADRQRRVVEAERLDAAAEALRRDDGHA